MQVKDGERDPKFCAANCGEVVVDGNVQFVRCVCVSLCGCSCVCLNVGV